MPSTTLVCDGAPVASIDVAESARERMRGLLGRSSLAGALLFPGTRSVHTFGMKFAIDVAFCDSDMRVIDVTSMLPNRLGKPRWRASQLIEARKGAFSAWGLQRGSQLELRR